MEDVNARIIVTAEAANATQAIKGLRDGLSGVTDARLKDLKISQSKARLELAEYNSMIAAQKAYNAEISLEGAKKRLAFRKRNGADVKEMDQLNAVVEKLTGQYLTLANAEAAANLQAYQANMNHQSLVESLNNMGVSVDRSGKKMSLLAIATRALGRVFKTDVGSGVGDFNANMFKMGIIAAGVTSAMKLVKLGVDAYHNSLREEVDIQSANAQSLKESWSNYKLLRDGQAEAINTLEEYSGRSNLTANEQIKLSQSIKKLSVEFAQLGINVDQSNVKMSDFYKISARIRQNEIDKEIRNLEGQLRGNESTMQALIKQRDKSGFGFGDFRIGGEKEILEAAREIERIGKANTEIRIRLNALRKMTPEKDAEEKNNKQMEYANQKIDERISKLKQEIEMQNLLAVGKEREVEILKIRNKLDEERSRLSAAEAKIFDERRDELEREMLASYDNRKRLENIKPEAQKHTIDWVREFSKLRQTSQGAVLANSMEGVRLQSRQLMSPTSGDPQKQSAQSLATLTTQGREILKKMDVAIAAVTGTKANTMALAGIAGIKKF